MAQLQLEYTPGDMIAEKYEIVEHLGESPLGVQYRVRHIRHENTVRLVLLDPKIAGREHKDDIVRAFRTSRSVEHKSLLKFGEIGQHQGVAFVTMEDFDGSPLRELIEQVRSRDGEFSMREAAQIVIQAMDAAQTLHESGTFVRAIRPEYILVNMRRAGPGGRNVVIDVRLWGGAMWDLVPSGDLAEDDYARGDGHYMAPELKGTDPTPTAQSDVYSGGVIFYELLTGSPPIGTYQMPRARREELPKHVDDVIEIALAPSPEDRYPAAKDLAVDIQRCFEGILEEDEPVSKTWRTVLLLGSVVVMGVGLFVARQSAINPFDVAMQDDNDARRAVLEGYERPSPEEARTLLKNHPPNMMLIPAGPYITGRLLHEPTDVGGGRRAVAELPAFVIDVFEYPNLAGAPPTYGVTYKKAKTLCEEAGKRLCSAAEFEKACRGPENFVYSYGDAYDTEFCGAGVDDIHTSGQYPECKSSWGVYDISGNFREWTSTNVRDDRYLVVGGLPQSAEKGTRCNFGTDLLGSFADDTLSFRCCRDADAPPWTPPPAKEGEEGDEAE